MDVKQELDEIRERCDKIEKHLLTNDERLGDFLAREVMGWREGPGCWLNAKGHIIEVEDWNPEKNLSQARQVLDAMWEKGYSYYIDAQHDGIIGGEYFTVRFSKEGHRSPEYCSSTLPRAICEAAKKAVEG